MAEDAGDERYAYERIVDELTRCIGAGTLRAGDRLPSVRGMSAQWKVSVPTVLQAYRVLTTRRLIAARPKSGYFVRTPAGDTLRPRAAVPHSTASAVTTGDYIVDFLESVADPTLYPLANALPDAELLPMTRLARILGSVSRREPVRTATVYTLSGSEELRAEIARRAFAARVPIAPGDVIITNGCTEAMALGLRAIATPGQTVIVESPAYFGTLQVIEALGLHAREVITDPVRGMDPGALDRALDNGAAAVVLTPTVHNPLGAVMSDARRETVAGVLDRHGVPVIEDDTYADLHNAPVRPPSLRAFVRKAQVLTCGSFSKTLASAYRVGWIVPGTYRAAVLRLKAATSSATSMPVQLALAEYLRGGGYERHLRALQLALRPNVDRIREEVAARMPAGSRISVPAGGFLLWIELDPVIDALELSRRCMRRGVSIAPGPVFSASGGLTNFIRINAGLLWCDEYRDALDAISTETRGLLR